MTALDAAACKAVDSTGQFGETLDLAEHLRDAVWRVESSCAAAVDAAGGLIVAGMGGSAVGGRLALAGLGARAARPIAIADGYELPGWAGPQTLVLCSSYSGSTEETLACYDDAAQRGAPRGRRQKCSDVMFGSSPIHAMNAVPAASTDTAASRPSPIWTGSAAAEGAASASTPKTTSIARRLIAANLSQRPCSAQAEPAAGAAVTARRLIASARRRPAVRGGRRARRDARAGRLGAAERGSPPSAHG
jgi:hypothetical protein